MFARVGAMVSSVLVLRVNHFVKSLLEKDKGSDAVSKFSLIISAIVVLMLWAFVQRPHLDSSPFASAIPAIAY